MLDPSGRVHAMSTPAPRSASPLRERFYPESRFGGYTDVDGTIAFYLRVNELLGDDHVALDVGCGRGTQGEDPVKIRRRLRILRGRCSRVIGLDVDAAAADNRFVDAFVLMDDPRRWPVDSGSADLVLADFVLEHVEDPEAFFAEAARVLRSGGHLCLRTVNVRSYLGLASRLVPTSRHRSVLRRTHPGRLPEDVFPTVYRCNSRRKLRGALEHAGFDAVVVGREAEPDYLTFSATAYRLGRAWARVAPEALRAGLFAFARLR